MVKAKDLHTYMSIIPSEADIKETCKQFGLKIMGNDKNSKIDLRSSGSNKTHLSLGFYTNSLGQNFFDESIIAHCLHHQYLTTNTNSFSKQSLFESVKLVQSIFKGEFIGMNDMTMDQMDVYLKIVQNIGFIQIDKQEIVIKQMSKSIMV